MKYRRGKPETKKWLQTPEGQVWLENKITDKDAAKSARRDQIDIAAMKDAGLKVECVKCLHQTGHHCDLHLPDGCLDFLEVHTLRTATEITVKACCVLAGRRKRDSMEIGKQ